MLYSLSNDEMQGVCDVVSVASSILPIINHGMAAILRIYFVGEPCYV